MSRHTSAGRSPRTTIGADGPVAVLSHGFWQREYGGGSDVIGKAIALDGYPFTIIGVSQRDFRGVQIGRAFDVAAPLGTEPIVRGAESSLDRRSNWWLTVVGRLAPGQTRAQAQGRLRAFQPQLREATMPQDWQASDQAEYLDEPITLTAGGTGISNLRDRYSQPLYVLLAIVGLVLAIACANMATSCSHKSVSRRKELAVRLSLGAGRWRLFHQPLVESIMLSTIGALAGLVIARWGSRAIVAMLSTRTQVGRRRPRYGLARVRFHHHRRPGHWPAVRRRAGVARHAPDTNRRAGRSFAWRGQRRRPVSSRPRPGRATGRAVLRPVFGSTLFVRTLVSLTSQDMGFESSRVLVASLDLRRTVSRPRIACRCSRAFARP